MRNRLLGLGLGLFGVVGCADPVSALVVATSADADVRKRVDTIVITGQRGSNNFSGTYRLTDPGFRLPGTLLFEPEDPEDVPGASLSVKVSGLSGGSEVLSRSARVYFLKGKVKLLRLPLSGKCLPEVDPCKGLAGKTCDDGVCVDEQIDLVTLPDFSGNDGAVAPFLSAGGSGGAGDGGAGGAGAGGAGAGGAGMGGEAGSGGAPDPCEGAAPISITAVEGPTGALAADAPFSVKVTATGGLGTYTFSLKTDQQETEVASVTGEGSAEIAAFARRCGQVYRVEVKDATCAGLAPASQQLSLTVEQGTWVTAACAADTPLQCGSSEHPWCTIQGAQTALSERAKSEIVTLRIAGGGVFTGPIDMVHRMPIEGGYPADFSSQIPGDAAPRATITASGVTSTVRWLAPEDAENPLVASLSRVAVAHPPLSGDEPHQALLVQGKVQVELQKISVDAAKQGATISAALSVQGAGAQLSLSGCSLRGASIKPSGGNARSSAVHVEGSSVSLSILGASDLRGGAPESPPPGVDDLVESFGLLWSSPDGSLKIDQSTLVGSDSPTLDATGLRVEGPASLIISGATLRGGAASKRATGFELAARPASFTFEKTTVEGLTEGAGQGRAIAMTSIPRPEAGGSLALSLDSVTLRGATGGAPSDAVGLDMACFSTPTPAPPSQPTTLTLEVTGSSQMIGADGQSKAQIAKGILAVCDDSDSTNLAILVVKDTKIEGGVSGDEERVGVWLRDVVMEAQGGTIQGSSVPGGKLVIGLKAGHDLRSPDLTVIPGTGGTTPQISGGRGQGVGDEPATTAALSIDRVGALKLEKATLRGCVAPGCESGGWAWGMRVALATTLDVSGCDIEAGPIGLGAGGVGEAVGVDIETAGLLGQAIIRGNSRIVGASAGGLKPRLAIGVRAQNGPLQLLDNQDIRGGTADETTGVLAVLPPGTPEVQARDLLISGNTIRGGNGAQAVGMRLSGFTNSKIFANRIDAQGQAEGPCASSSRGLWVEWLPGSFLINNQVFGGQACSAVACEIDTRPEHNGDPQSEAAMLLAHTLCLAPGRSAEASSDATALLVRHGNASTLAKARKLLLLGNILGAGSLTEASAGALVLAQLQPIEQEVFEYDLLHGYQHRQLFVSPSAPPKSFLGGTPVPFNVVSPVIRWTEALPADAAKVAFTQPSDSDPLGKATSYRIGGACDASGLMYTPDPSNVVYTAAQQITGALEHLAKDIDGHPRPGGGPWTVGPDECGTGP